MHNTHTNHRRENRKSEHRLTLPETALPPSSLDKTTPYLNGVTDNQDEPVVVPAQLSSPGRPRLARFRHGG